MSVESINFLEDKTVFNLEEPRPYGESDISRIVEVLHSEISKLETITKNEIENLPDEPQKCDLQKAEKYIIPEIGTIIFINDYDCDFSSASHRLGSHITKGPYLLIVDK